MENERELGLRIFSLYAQARVAFQLGGDMLPIARRRALEALTLRERAGRLFRRAVLGVALHLRGRGAKRPRGISERAPFFCAQGGNSAIFLPPCAKVLDDSPVNR